MRPDMRELVQNLKLPQEVLGHQMEMIEMVHCTVQPWCLINTIKFNSSLTAYLTSDANSEQLLIKSCSFITFLITLKVLSKLRRHRLLLITAGICGKSVPL